MGVPLPYIFGLFGLLEGHFCSRDFGHNSVMSLFLFLPFVVSLLFRITPSLALKLKPNFNGRTQTLKASAQSHV